MLVALAAFDPLRERRRQMAERGRSAVEGLAALHRELLTSRPTPERLEQLAEWVRQAEPCEDPALAEILVEIELRVRVELAKFDIEV